MRPYYCVCTLESRSFLVIQLPEPSSVVLSLSHYEYTYEYTANRAQRGNGSEGREGSWLVALFSSPSALCGLGFGVDGLVLASALHFPFGLSGGEVDGPFAADWVSVSVLV